MPRLRATAAAVGEHLARLGAKVVGRVDSLNTYRLRFDSAEALQAAVS